MDYITASPSYTVSKTIVHPNYYASDDSLLILNDIALLKLNREIEFSDKIAPLCLPDKGN